MRRLAGRIGLLAPLMLALIPSVMAKSRPIEQLPGDLLHWSTLWVEIPQQMVEVGREAGPVAAMTLGPAKGTAQLVQSASQELWNAAEADEGPAHPRREQDAHRVILRYEF